MIPIFHPALFRRQWIIELFKVFGTRWIGQAHKVDEFEQAFADKFDYKYCVSTNSGTSALELAYKLAGIKENDEVITPVLTCTATNIPLLRLGAKIKFADINPQTLTISLDSIKRLVRPKTKAVVLVNLGGIKCNEKIYRYLESRGIYTIVDACQSLGIIEPEGDYVAYSFQAIKHFTTGDGGMLVVRDKDNYDRAKKLRWFGIDREAKRLNDWQPYNGREMTMDIEEPGYKFHMNDIQATMGLVGLNYSDELLKKRIKIANIYDKYLSNVHKVRGGSYWLYGIVTEHKDLIAEELKKIEVETNVAHLRNDIFTVFGGKRLDLPIMNDVEDKYLYLPLHQNVTEKQAHLIGNKIKEVLDAMERNKL